MSSSSRLPETCRVYLDLAPLPFQPDGSADLVALSPFTIEWGVATPWAATTPNVLKITLLDQGDRFSKSADLLMGHRITVTPDWDNPAYTALNYCLFDGYVTDVKILDNDHGKNRLSVTASDRLYILKTDCRKGPNSGTDDKAARGWQWWMQGAYDVAQIRRHQCVVVPLQHVPRAVPRRRSQKLHRLGRTAENKEGQRQVSIRA